MWSGGEPPATALNTMRRHVSYLRQMLGSRDVIVARPPGYLLDPVRVDTDVAAAKRLIEQGIQLADRVRERQLRDALALWRGRPLADVDGPCACRKPRPDHATRRYSLIRQAWVPITILRGTNQIQRLVISRGLAG
jgi:hypothetical protein